jgi:predicted enzyme related to lactoylglutathione lyase
MATEDDGRRKNVNVSVSIDVPTLADGIRFYGGVFGFTESSRPHEGYAVLMAGSARIGLLAKQAGTFPAKDCTDVRRYDRHWTPVHIDFNVSDFDLVLEKALAAGAKCEHVHKIVGFPPVAFCSDPFGHGFCIIGKRE